MIVLVGMVLPVDILSPTGTKPNGRLSELSSLFSRDSRPFREAPEHRFWPNLGLAVSEKRSCRRKEQDSFAEHYQGTVGQVILKNSRALEEQQKF